jgi:dTDP-4-dehydrorhamnose 3,5-epimerase
MQPSFNLSATPIEGVHLVSRNPFDDARGQFGRLFCRAELQQAAWAGEVAQINISHTYNIGAIRGMHFQTGPAAESKLISCIAGRVWDVAVDLRKTSQTYLKWFAAELNADNHLAMLIPKGVAHGFQVLQAHSVLIYVHSEVYTPSHEAGVRADDPALAIDWPLPLADWSQRDQAFALISPEFESSFV